MPTTGASGPKRPTPKPTTCLLLNAGVRRNVLASITDPFVLEFWTDEFPNFPKGAIDPITNKLSQFALSTTVREILGQAHSQLNLFELMQEKKIFRSTM